MENKPPSKPARERGTCQLCQRSFGPRQLSRFENLRPSLAEYLSTSFPVEWHPGTLVCHDCLGRARLGYLLDRLEEERGELSAVEEDIARKAAVHATLAEDIEEQFQKDTTRGQRIADAVARVGGSWTFLIGFLLVLVGWTILNSVFLAKGAFDPYPYILLNLLLSCLAAIQAPIIMMSQNRMAARDRLRADEDFRVNLKAEIEIATLHEKVDHLLHSQWQRMVELQQMQLDLLHEVASRRR